MQEQKYYDEIKDLIETKEINGKARYLKDNKDTILINWNIGRLIVEAQGGELRAKYGDNLIKKWAIELEAKYGSNYGVRNLNLYRKFYITFLIVHALRAQLTWTHYKIILSIKNESEGNYYKNQVILNNLSSRELISEIKNKFFERLSYADKTNIKLLENSNDLTINDMIKDPILIKSNNNIINEKALHKYIIEMLEERFLELGTGFALIGHEYKIQIEGHTYSLDLLFFNYKLNCFIVVELKLKSASIKDIDQIKFYTKLVDKNLKENNHNNTIGLLIVKKKDKYVIEYATDSNIYLTNYELINV